MKKVVVLSMEYLNFVMGFASCDTETFELLESRAEQNMEIMFAGDFIPAKKIYNDALKIRTQQFN